MILVGEDRENHAGGTERIEHLDRSGVGGGVIFFVLAVVSTELGKRLLEHTAIAGVLGRHEALDQLEHTVAYLVAILVDGEGGPTVHLAGMVTCGGKVVEGVQDGAVQIKDDMGIRCGHADSFADRCVVSAPYLTHGMLAEGI